MRYGVIAIAIMSVLLGSHAQSSHGEVIYGVGEFMDMGAFSGIHSLDTATGTAELLIHTPDIYWSGATDGLSSDPTTFFAVGNPTFGPAPTSNLYRINTADWSYNLLGQITTGVYNRPIRELALYEPTQTLYGTDGVNLYTVPIAGGAATFVNTFRKDVAITGDPIFGVYSLDYDPSAGKLIGTSWRPGVNYDDPGETDLYKLDLLTGVGTLVGNTGLAAISDVLYSHDPGNERLLSAGRIPMQVFDLGPGGTPFNIHPTTAGFYGLANATAASSPTPYSKVPLSIPYADVENEILAYRTYTAVSAQAYVHISNDLEQLTPGFVDSPLTVPPDDPTTHFGQEANAILTGVLASVTDSQNNTPWQETDGSAVIDVAAADGIVKISSTMTLTARGSDEGLTGQTGFARESGVTGNAYINGAIAVGIPDGGSAGDSVLFGVSIYTGQTMDLGMEVLDWTLKIQDYINPVEPIIEPVSDVQAALATDPTVYLDLEWSFNDPGEIEPWTSDSWAFSFYAPAGQILDYTFTWMGYGQFDALDMIDPEDPFGNDLSANVYADVEFGAVTPEPATMLLLCGGAVPLILRRRRRRGVADPSATPQS